MTQALKPDAQAIIRFMSDLEAAPWLGQARQWWPKCLFRTEHLEAAVRILNSGRILSRSAAQAAGVLEFDSASPGVIRGTADQWKTYVRLYFRPRAPTQFVNEGFRPVTHYEYGAHCPVPIVFIFNSHSLMSRAGTEFSDGTLAKGARTGGTVEFLRTIPFRDVYHDSWFDPGLRNRIIYHRHAEVVVPGEMDLSSLRFVGCRSQAEYETLLYMLTPQARTAWSSRIGLGTRTNLHYGRWNYVDQVSMDRNTIAFAFNPACSVRGPFQFDVQLVDAAGDSYRYQMTKNLETSFRIQLATVRHPESYQLTLRLDDRIAYKKRFEDVSPLL